MLEHAGLMIYLWTVLGKLGVLFTAFSIILGIVGVIGLLIIALDSNSISILTSKTREEYESLNIYSTIDYSILVILRKVLITFMSFIVISVFVPNKTQFLAIYAAQPIIKTLNSNKVLTPKNLVKIEKIINKKIDELSK